jgi:hypothetical protein
VTRTQRRPQTVAQLAAWQQRWRTYSALGVGGPACKEGTCHFQAAYATGGDYGPVEGPCEPCERTMRAWGTASVVDARGYRHLPAGVLVAA